MKKLKHVTDSTRIVPKIARQFEYQMLKMMSFK